MLFRWKTPISIALLLVFFFNTCMFGCVFSFVLYSHQHEQKTNLHNDDEPIVQLNISADAVEKYHPDFHWEKDWEFEFKGEMYDVVDSYKSGNEWIFHCKHDKKEEILKRHAAREAKRNQEESDSRVKKNLKAGSVYLYESSFIFFNHSEFVSTMSPNTTLPSELRSDVPSPPPWFI